VSRVYLRWNRLLPTGYGRLLDACEGSDFLEWPGCFGGEAFHDRARSYQFAPDR